MQRIRLFFVSVVVLILTGLAGCNNEAPKDSAEVPDSTPAAVPPQPAANAAVADVAVAGGRKALKCDRRTTRPFKRIVDPATSPDTIRIRIRKGFGHVLKVPKSALAGVTEFRIKARTHDGLRASPRVAISISPGLKPNAVLFLDLNYEHCTSDSPNQVRGGFFENNVDSSQQESGADFTDDEVVENVEVRQFEAFSPGPFTADTLWEPLGVHSGYAVASN